MIAGSLKIMLWDKEIGRLSWDARRGVSFFEYNPAFLGGGLDPFPLVASVKSPASRRPIMGDYHLSCEVEGKERKFVITNKKEEYALIDKVGIDNLTDKQLCSLVETLYGHNHMSHLSKRNM